ncbi:MAG: PD40 domain-containing protein [Acidobacteria bacterium]|nr:PD40 domain-containing protein [Acidobacteriota bacterium]
MFQGVRRFSNLLKTSILSFSTLMLLSSVCYGQGQQPPATILISAPIRNNTTNSTFVGGVNSSISGDSNTVSYTVTNNPTNTGFPAVARDRRGLTDGGALISRSQVDGAPREGFATSINRNGNVVVFQSSASDIVSGAPVGIVQPNVYLADRAANTTVLVSRPLDPTTIPNGSSGSPSVNADGSLVAFVSTATNISTQSMNQVSGIGNIFLFNRAAQTIDLVSKDAQGNIFTSPCFFPSISEDGTVIVFASAGQIFVKRSGSNSAQPLGQGLPSGTLPVVSGDGSTVAYITTTSDVVVRTANSTVRFPVNAIVPSQNSRNSRPTLSRNGRFLAVTAAQPLAPNDMNGFTDIYIFDLNLGPTQTPTVISLKDTGDFGLGDSFDPVISDDGDVVAFTSNDRLTIDNAGGPTNIYARINLVGGGALGTGVGVLNLGPICIAGGRALSPTEIEISWGFGLHNDQLRGSKVEVSRFEGNQLKVVTTVPADGKALFVDSGLKANTKYDYRLWISDPRGFAYAVDFSAKTKKVKKNR